MIEEAVTRGQLEAVLRMKTGKCDVEDHLLVVTEEIVEVMIAVIAMEVMMVAVPLRDVMDPPVMMDLETGDVDLLVMIVTCAVDPLEMKDLVPPLRDLQENKTKAGPLLRPS